MINPDDAVDREPVKIPLEFAPSSFVIAAICGNWWQESTLNPGLYEGRKEVPLTDNNVYGGYGLGQWTNAPSKKVYRRTALANYLASNGWPYTSGPGQMCFFIVEDIWYKTAQAADFTNLKDYLSSDSRDLEYLTYAFMRGWEGIWDGTQGKRVEYAQKCWKAFDEWEEPSGWVINNKYLSNKQRVNNARLIWRYMTGDEVPGDTPGPIKPHPTPSAKRRGLRVWQMIRYH
ncbi:MAG: phage tail tip lysozyme [Lachnospiraceae bacterium]|nr:phage tail tip lysozyme [Lachnospiraceae bacterium]